jgi:tetratricopeptide (TPR) repeat protein
VRGELDWIAMKALDKDRTRRYEGASALARDIEHYLDDEPVEACPPSAGYRFRKFVRRNKGAVVTGLGMFLLLAGGIVGTTWGLIRAERARMHALAARQAEAEQRRLAEVNEQKARAAADAERTAKDTAQARAAESQAVLDFVERKVFAAARPQGVDGGLGREVTLRRAVEAALPFVETSFTKQPMIEARLRSTLANSFWYLGDAQIAVDQFQAARAICTKLLGENHPDTLGCMGGLANAYETLGRTDEALGLRQETLARRKAVLGPDHPDTLGSAMALANTYGNLGRFADALKLHEETLALRKAKLGPDHPQTLRSMNNLASCLSEMGRQAEALKLREETLSLRKAKLGADHPDTLRSMMALANSFYFVGRDVEAKILYEETLALEKTKLGPDHPETLRTMGNLANSYERLARHADALKLREETLRLVKAKLGPDHANTLTAMGNLADSYSNLGRHTDALKLREETFARQKARLGADHPNTLLGMNNLANSYADLGRREEALKLFQETLALRKAKLGPDHPDTFMSMWGVAGELAKLDRGAEAVALIDDCLRRASGKVVDPGLVPAVIDIRIRHFEKSKDAAGCRATAEIWENLDRTDSGSLYIAARYRAVTAAVVRVKDKSAAGPTHARSEADQAMTWLKKAVAAGYRDAKNMKEDKDLAVLRDREDFKALLANLEAAK